MPFKTLFQLVLVSFAVVAVHASTESRALERQYDAESIRRVEIELPPDTTLRVRTWSDPIISISGEVTVAFEGSPSTQKRRAILEGIEIIAESRGSRLRLIDDRKGQADSGWARRLDTDFDVTITVPEWTHIEVRQRDGSVNARGKLGDVTVGMRAGQIEVAVPKERVKELTARTRVGEVTADLGRVTEEHEGLFPGEARYENPSGSTSIQLTLTFGDISVELTE